MVDVFLFAGQSNMAGRGIPCERFPERAPAVLPGAGWEYRAISAPGQLVLITEPFGIHENNPDGIHENLKTGSMVSAFVNAYYAETHVPVVGVSASKGGSVMAEWQPGKPYLTDALNRLADARNWLNQNEYRIRHTFVLWCQGESDGDAGTKKEAYLRGFEWMLGAMLKAGVERLFLVRIGHCNVEGSFFRMDRFTGQALNLEGVSSEELQNALEKTTNLTIWSEKPVQGYAVRSDMGVYSVVTILVPLSYPGGARVGTVMYLVDSDQFADWHASFGLKDTDVVFLHDSQIITAQNRSGIPGETLLQAAASGQIELRYGGKRYHILTEDGNSRLSCVALVSDDEFAVALSGSVKALVLVSAFAAAVAVLLITRFVQSRMRGIKLLHSMLAEHEPTGNELLEIRDGIQRLIDENASMTTRLENMADVQRGEFVRRFLLGTFQDEDAFLQMAEQVSVNVDTRFFAVAIVAKAAESSYELTVDKIDRLFDETVSGAPLIPVSAENHLILLAFANEKGQLRTFLESKFTGLKACSASMIMGVSGFHTVWTEGQRAYLEAENAFEMRFVKGNTTPIYFEELGENQTLEASFNRQAVDHLRQALRKGDETRVEKALTEVSQAMHDTRSSLFGFRCMYSEIITAVSAEARQSGVNEEELYDLFRLSRCLSVDELDGMLKQVCRKIVSLQTKAETEEVPEPVKNAYDLIQRRFSEPGLTMASIAEKVGMSDSRLSVDFKRVYQETPLECITHARMHRAQHLLGDTEMPVKDIATECGYYDISAFNRRFKSYSGCTPQQFRAQQSEKPVDQ